MPAFSEAPGLHVISSDESGIVLELRTPAFQVVRENGTGEPCSRLVVAGYGETGTAGLPALPVKGALVGLPPQAQASLTVLDVEPV